MSDTKYRRFTRSYLREGERSRRYLANGFVKRHLELAQHLMGSPFGVPTNIAAGDFAGFVHSCPSAGAFRALHPNIGVLPVSIWGKGSAPAAISRSALTAPPHRPLMYDTYTARPLRRGFRASHRNIGVLPVSILGRGSAPAAIWRMAVSAPH